MAEVTDRNAILNYTSSTTVELGLKYRRHLTVQTTTNLGSNN